MSDDLIERLRAGCLPMKHDAADRIEAQAAEIEAYRRSLYLKQTLISDQAAEIERLREALTKISLRKWNSMTQGCNAAREASNIARAALAGKAEQ